MGHRLTSGQPCDLCGKPIRSDNKFGVCTRTPNCKAEYHRRRFAANPRPYRSACNEYRLRNLEQIREYDRQQSRTIPGKASGLLNQAKIRARKNGLPFDLTREWVMVELEAVIESGCPYLGIPIRLDCPVGSAHGPSIDQFIPQGGYTRDNCIIVSRRANLIKNNASPGELERLAGNVGQLSRTRFCHLKAAS